MSLTVVLLIVTVELCAAHQDVRELKAAVGENVMLECHGDGDAVTLLKWSRSDLDSHGYVFFYRDDHVYENYQHPSFCGRVALRDATMTDGDVSVTLRNVSVGDTGTYQCHVLMTNTGRKKRHTGISTTVELMVEEGLSPEPGDNGRDARGRVGLILLIGPITAVLGILTKFKTLTKLTLPLSTDVKLQDEL